MCVAKGTHGQRTGVSWNICEMITSFPLNSDNSTEQQKVVYILLMLSIVTWTSAVQCALSRASRFVSVQWIHIINYWFGHCSFSFVVYCCDCGLFSRGHCDCFMLRAQQIKIKGARSNSGQQRSLVYKQSWWQHNSDDVVVGGGGDGDGVCSRVFSFSLSLSSFARSSKTERECDNTKTDDKIVFICTRRSADSRSNKETRTKATRRTNGMVTNLPGHKKAFTLKWTVLSGFHIGTAGGEREIQRAANESESFCNVDACCVSKASCFAIRLEICLIIRSFDLLFRFKCT